jgi:hypothetical protein
MNAIVNFYIAWMKRFRGTDHGYIAMPRNAGKTFARGLAAAANAPSDTLPDAALDKVAAGVQADLDALPRRCCDCSGWFDGPGPRCPVCIDRRNAAGLLEDLRLLRTAATGAVVAIEAALVAADTGLAAMPDKAYEGLWDAMIALKAELPKA